jgi:hypothetical protein
VFGDYVDLEYMKDIRTGTVPANVSVCEFFFKSGALIGNDYAQQHFICTNYTFAPRDILLRGVNVLAQMVAKREIAGADGPEVRYSLSCNPETSLDMYPHLADRKLKGEAIAVIGVVHADLPYMVNDAEISPDFFDIVVDEPQYSTRLFGAPNLSIATPDYMIGLHASALLRDGGTLQIGIGWAMPSPIPRSCAIATTTFTARCCAMPASWSATQRSSSGPAGCRLSPRDCTAPAKCSCPASGS